MKQFEPGKTYYTRSICDHNCIYAVTIISRTAKSVLIEESHRGQSRRKITVYNGVEQIKPHGNYSMCAVISADKEKEILPDWAA